MKKHLTILIALLAMLASACAGSVFSLSVGECFDNPGDSGVSGEITTVPMRDCSEPHDNEVYASIIMQNDDFPGEEAASQIAEQGCLDRFEDFVGFDYQTSDFGFSSLTPTRESWAQDDREILCVISNYDGTQKTGTARNAGR